MHSSHAVSMSSDGNMTVLEVVDGGKNQVKRKRTAKQAVETAVKFN